jgi:hypothetical protein
MVKIHKLSICISAIWLVLSGAIAQTPQAPVITRGVELPNGYRLHWEFPADHNLIKEYEIYQDDVLVGTVDMKGAPGPGTLWIEEDGIVKVEAESYIPNTWSLVSAPAGYSGKGFLRANTAFPGSWQESLPANSTQVGPAENWIQVKFKITTPGRYRMDVRNYFTNSEANDVWMRFTSNDPEWHKVGSTVVDQNYDFLGWSFSQNDQNLEHGEYTAWLAPRSAHFGVDYVVIYRTVLPNGLYSSMNKQDEPRLITAPVSSNESTTFLVTGLTESTSYRFIVKAIGKDDSEVESSVHEVTIGEADDTPLPAIENLQASDVTSSSMTLRWNATLAPGQIVWYVIEAGDQKWISYTNEIRLTNLTALTTYDFKVFSTDLSGRNSAVVNLSQETDPGVEFLRANRPPTLDGQIGDFWSNPLIAKHPIQNLIEGSIRDENDLSAYWQAVYDDNNCYVLVHVTDDLLSNSLTTSYQNDYVEIYFDADNSKASTYQNDYQIRFVWAKNDVISNPATTGITFAQTTLPNETGYIMEVQIPWSSVKGANIAAGKKIGFDIMVGDNDETTTRKAVIGWNTNNNDNWFNPSNFGTIMLSGSTVATTNITEATKNLQAVVYPSPARDYLKVSLQGKESISGIEIFGMSGNLLSVNYKLDGSGATVDTGSLPTGMYFIRIKSGQSSVIRKFIISKN